MSLVECWANGSNGAIDLAEKVAKLSEKENNFKYIYDIESSISDKIEKICTKVYGANDVIYTDTAMQNMEKYEKMGYGNLPICMSKTQYSFSDDPKNLECLEPFSITIKNLELKAGAGFIVAFTGNVITMPGLPRKPAAENIDIDENGNITGLF